MGKAYFFLCKCGIFAIELFIMYGMVRIGRTMKSSCHHERKQKLMDGKTGQAFCPLLLPLVLKGKHADDRKREII